MVSTARIKARAKAPAKERHQQQQAMDKAMATAIAKAMAMAMAIAPAKEMETAKEKANPQHVRTSAQVVNAEFLRTISVNCRKSLGAATECFLICLTNFVRKHVKNVKITWDTL